MKKADALEQIKALWIFLVNRISSVSIFFATRRNILRLLGIQVAQSAAIHRNVEFMGYGKCYVGKNSVINRGCILDNRRGIEIGSNVNVGPFVSIYSMGHDYNSPEFAVSGSLIVIENDCIIYARAMIMPGVRIGSGSVILAGAVVTRSVPPYSVYGGVPARKLGIRTGHPKYRLSYKVWFSR